MACSIVEIKYRHVDGIQQLILLLQILERPLRADFHQSRNKYKTNDKTLVENWKLNVT